MPLLVHVPLTGGAHQLVLSFSTPILPVADALVELFDAVARTVRWCPVDERDDGALDVTQPA